ncbi:hypothetical protein Q3G72_018122 [Acer saccharum]|nr:hypothetical protein Q3G72_018122 [Acer saccharum]
MLPLRMLVMIFCRKLLTHSKLLVQKNTAEAPLASAKTEEATAEALELPSAGDESSSPTTSAADSVSSISFSRQSLLLVAGRRPSYLK